MSQKYINIILFDNDFKKFIILFYYIIITKKRPIGLFNYLNFITDTHIKDFIFIFYIYL